MLADEPDVDFREKFAYDKNGNFLSSIFCRYPSMNDTIFYNYNGTNQLTSVFGKQNSLFDYDGNGNLSFDSAKHATFYYSPLNNLTRIDLANSLGTDYFEFAYNQEGLRVLKKYFYRYLEPCGDPGEPDDPQGMGESEGASSDDVVSDGVSGEGMDGEGGGGGQQYCLRSRTVTRRYYLSGGKVLMEKDMETGQITKYIYAGDERIAMIDYQGRVYYYVKDHLGSTRVLVRDDGVTSAKYYRYTAYGDCKKETMSIAQPNKYTGKPLDGELGLNLYYFGARYYMANLGRWLTADPMLGKYPGWSPYAYVLNNPLILKDPNGKAAQLAAIGGGAYVGAALIAAAGFTYSYATNPDVRNATESFGNALVTTANDAGTRAVGQVVDFAKGWIKRIFGQPRKPVPEVRNHKKAEQSRSDMRNPKGSQPTNDSPTRDPGEPPNVIPENPPGKIDPVTASSPTGSDIPPGGKPSPWTPPNATIGQGAAAVGDMQSTAGDINAGNQNDEDERIPVK